MPTCDATRYTHKEFGVERSGFLVSSQEVVEKAPWLILRAATDTNKPFSEGKRVRGFCLDETTLGAQRWSCEIVSCFGPFLFSKQSYAWVRRRNKWSTPFTSQLPLKQRSKTVIQWNHLLAYLGRYWSRPILKRFWTKEADPKNRTIMIIIMYKEKWVNKQSVDMNLAGWRLPSEDPYTVQDITWPPQTWHLYPKPERTLETWCR